MGCHFLLQGISQPRDWTHISGTGRRILYHQTIREAHGLNCVPPNSYVEALIPYGNLFGDNAFKKVIKVKCGYKAGVLMLWMRLVPLQEAAAAAKSLQSCPNLCSPIDSSPPGFSIPGILQARILEWVAISFSNACMYAKSFQSYPTLCDPMDRSSPGSSVHGIL